MVIDAKREAVAVRHVGGLSVTQLKKLLDEARGPSRSDADTLVAQADKIAGDGNPGEAAKLYAAAIEAAPEEWPRFARVADALMTALAMTGKFEECVTRAEALYPRLTDTAAGASIAGTGLGCAMRTKDREKQVAFFEKETRRYVVDPKLDISDDDRSGMYIALIGAREAAKDTEGEKALEQEWVKFLEEAAAKAKTPEQRTVYDSHRLSAYLEVGTPEKAIPMLEQSARDFPDDYNPPARMALAYRAMKNYDDALAASDRALRMSYGPRKLGYLRTRADIYTDMGNQEAARRTVEEAIAYAKSLPKEQVREGTIAALEKKLAEMK
ncbi:MAG TPA: tetratricopeptide repeat protein [Thermoanaerobaculia bacterium]|nr:tetratricopeptide repeat protein [Thermoanaerobaculia bacterium]